MCRFFSMFHWKHPALEKYDWIFRLDEGITFHCELVRRSGPVLTHDRISRADRAMQQEDPFETVRPLFFCCSCASLTHLGPADDPQQQNLRCVRRCPASTFPIRPLSVLCLLAPR